MIATRGGQGSLLAEALQHFCAGGSSRTHFAVDFSSANGWSRTKVAPLPKCRTWRLTALPVLPSTAMKP